MAATIHPSHATIFGRFGSVSFIRIALPLALACAQLAKHLFQAGQDGDLALGVVQLDPFDTGFEPV